MMKFDQGVSPEALMFIIMFNNLSVICLVDSRGKFAASHSN